MMALGRAWSARYLRWPRSLLWRTFLLIALLMLLSVAAWFAIFRVYQEEPRARQMAQLIISVVNLTRSAIINAAPERRRALLLELSDREGIRIYPFDAHDEIAPLPDQALWLSTADFLRHELGQQTRFSLERNGEPAVFISFGIAEDGDNDYWLVLPRERIERLPHRQLLDWGLAALLLSLTGAYLIVVSITRPLRALARATREIGRGRQPPPLAADGPSEIAAVAHAFNQMSQDLARLDSDRALILAGLSHDLRTPLTRLRMGLEILLPEEATATDLTREGMIADIEDLNQTIDQFLDFAREPGHESREECDLSALLRDLANLYARRGIELETHIAAMPPCSLRTQGIRRAVSNLIENALRHAGSSGLYLALSASNDSALVIEVGDRGPGIGPADIERLKLPFTRLDAARGNSYGAGLGLAIVERIVRSHEGQFDLLPRPGGGLIARLTLPRHGT